jgi:hypothetical protein
VGQVQLRIQQGWGYRQEYYEGLSVPDYKKKYENEDTGFYADEKGEKKDAKKLSEKLSEKFEDELKKRADELVDGNSQMFPRDVHTPAAGSTMEVNENNEVFINDNMV